LSEIIPLLISYHVPDGTLASLGADWFGSLVRSVWTGGQELISVFSLAIVTPVVAGYLIYDWNRMLAAVDNWTPPPRRPTVRALAREIDDTIGGFVRGQGTLCLILCVYYAVALWLAGLNHSLLIGVAAGTISFVPYLGSITGLAVATSVAIAQFWPSWSSIVVVPMIFVIGQAVADYVLSPYLVGRRVNLHPVWMIFALFAFGYIFGFLGLLLAVPLAAACRVLLRFALEQIMQARSIPPDRTRPRQLQQCDLRSIKPIDAASWRRGAWIKKVSEMHLFDGGWNKSDPTESQSPQPMTIK
jgi:predicted PurR-regulated permease PerM